MLTLKSLIVKALGENFGSGFRKTPDLEGKVYVLDFTGSKKRLHTADFQAEPVIERRKAAGYRGY